VVALSPTSNSSIKTEGTTITERSGKIRPTNLKEESAAVARLSGMSYLARLLILIALAGTTLSQEQTVVVQGTIRRSDTLTPIANAQIRLGLPMRAMGIAQPLVEPKFLTAGPDGHFTFRDVRPGAYTLQIGLKGYFGSNGAPSEYVDVTAEAGRLPADVDVLLDPGAQISGRVLDTEGNPIPNVRVAYLSQDVRGLSVHYPDSEFPTTTNADGEYKLAWIPSGAYYIRAEFPGESAALQNRTTFFPDALQMANARRIVTGPGSTFAGLDIRVQKTATITISGKILRPDNVTHPDPPPELSLILYPRDSRSPGSSSVGRVVVDPAAGQFEIHGVPPGRYEIAAAQGYALSGRMFVDAGDRNIEGLSLVMKPSIEIKGRVTGLASPQTARLLLNFEGGPVRPQGGSIDARGEFSFSGAIEGSAFTLYPFGQAISGLPDGVYLRDMRQGARNIMESGTISFSDPAEAVELIVSTGGGSIDGVVSGNPRKGDYVILVPSGARRSNLALYRRARIEDGNRFTIPGVTPGSYKIFGWEGFYPSPISLLEPDFISRYEDRGTPVTVQEESRVQNIRVNLIPAGH
jgi:hypothetical protein